MDGARGGGDRRSERLTEWRNWNRDVLRRRSTGLALGQACGRGLRRAGIGEFLRTVVNTRLSAWQRSCEILRAAVEHAPMLAALDWQWDPRHRGWTAVHELNLPNTLQVLVPACSIEVQQLLAGAAPERARRLARNAARRRLGFHATAARPRRPPPPAPARTCVEKVRALDAGSEDGVSELRTWTDRRQLPRWRPHTMNVQDMWRACPHPLLLRPHE